MRKFLPQGVVRKIERVRGRERKRWIEEESVPMKDTILESKNIQRKIKERGEKISKVAL